MSNVFQTCLKGFKLKMMIVEPKMAQPVEPDEKPINLFSSTDQPVQLNRSTCSAQPIEECKKKGKF